MIEIDVKEVDQERVFELLTYMVAPRPIAWVSTVSKDGVLNLAPFSFFNAVCDEPPIVMLSISKRDTRRKDTAQNILDTKEFVVNLVSNGLINKVEISAKPYPPHMSEFEVCGLTPESSKKVRVPRVKESPGFLECVLYRHMEVYDYDLILGEVLYMGVRSLDYKDIKLVGRVKEGYIWID